MNTAVSVVIDQNLLIIDDETEVAKALVRQFRRKYNVFSANSAEDGFTIMEKENIQVVLSDQRMPGMTGIDFFSKIKDKYPDALKLILTGYTDIEAVIGAINQGQVFRYVTKPWNPDELESIISEAFEKYELITQNRKLIRSLQEVNITLEDKVKERTLSLEELNYDLVVSNREKKSYIGIIDAIFNAVPGLIYLYDGDGKLVRWNKKHELITGYSSEELSGMHLLDFYKGDMESRVKVTESVKTTMEKGYGETEAYLQKKDGTLIPMYFTASPVTIDGKKFFTGIGIDITDRKLAEEAIIKSEARLQELNATKDKFFSIIAHDLRSPFNGIIGFSTLVAQKVKEKNYDDLEEFAGIIQSSSKKAMNLLTNLMEWAGSQTGKIEFKPANFNLVALVEEVSGLLNSTAQQKSITITSQLPVQATVYADREMISTILRNLISNAIKFTKTGGLIVVSAKQKKGEWQFEVHDNGVGISKNSIEKLFRIDESFSTTGTQDESGTGLGLILCKEFIEKHGGKIRAESEPGKGSSFFFTIPCK